MGLCECAGVFLDVEVFALREFEFESALDIFVVEPHPLCAEEEEVLLKGWGIAGDGELDLFHGKGMVNRT